MAERQAQQMQFGQELERAAMSMQDAGLQSARAAEAAAARVEALQHEADEARGTLRREQEAFAAQQAQAVRVRRLFDLCFLVRARASVTWPCTRSQAREVQQRVEVAEREATAMRRMLEEQNKVRARCLLLATSHPW